MDAWQIDLIVARTDREQRAAARDIERGVFRRVRAGISVPAAALAGLPKGEPHLIGMRALALASDRPIVFSHWSAAVVHDLAVLDGHLSKVHVTFPEAGQRRFDRVAGHVFPVEDEEVVEVNGLLVTTAARTVVHIAGSGAFEDGVVIADSPLAGGLTRERLTEAVVAEDVRGPRVRGPGREVGGGVAQSDHDGAGPRAAPRAAAPPSRRQGSATSTSSSRRGRSSGSSTA